MKYLMLACFVTGIAAQMFESIGGGCLEQVECLEGQCCSGIPPNGGICRNLTVKGGKCDLIPRTAPIFGDFIIGPCPCSEGLECIQTGMKKNKGTCQPVPVPEEPAGDDDTAAVEPAAEEPAAEEPAAEQPAAEEPAAEEPSAEEQAAEEPAAEEPSAEAGGDSSAADSAAEAK